MPIAQKNILLNKFIDLNKTRYAEDVEALEVINKLTVDNLTISDEIHGLSGSSVTIKGSGLVAEDQTYIKADISATTKGWTTSNEGGLAITDIAELQNVSTPGAYEVDVLDEPKIILVLDSKGLVDAKAEVEALIATTFSHTMSASGVLAGGTSAGTVTWAADGADLSIQGSVKFISKAFELIVPATDLGTLEVPAVV